MLIRLHPCYDTTYSKIFKTVNDKARETNSISKYWSDLARRRKISAVKSAVSLEELSNRCFYVAIWYYPYELIAMTVIMGTKNDWKVGQVRDKVWLQSHFRIGLNMIPISFQKDLISLQCPNSSLKHVTMISRQIS